MESSTKGESSLSSMSGKLKAGGAIVALGVVLFVLLGTLFFSQDTNIVQTSDMVIPSACACPLEMEPVCGTNKVTYPNACTAECHGVEVAYEAACGEHAQETAPLPGCDTCDRVYAPVCGEDKQTYLNSCVARCSRVNVVKLGVCSAKIWLTPRTDSSGTKPAYSSGNHNTRRALSALSGSAWSGQAQQRKLRSLQRAAADRA